MLAGAYRGGRVGRNAPLLLKFTDVLLCYAPLLLEFTVMNCKILDYIPTAPPLRPPCAPLTPPLRPPALGASVRPCDFELQRFIDNE
jgi:hypothetical protein